MFDPQERWLQHVYVFMAAVAGAVTALSLMRWKEMSAPEIMLTLFVGASCAIFVTPWAAHALLGLNDTSVRTIAGLTYVTASGSNIIIPKLIKWWTRASGVEEDRR